MLDEELLVGPGRQARDTLRPLAYSTLADLVHHVKDRIDLDQVSKVIQVRRLFLFDSKRPSRKRETRNLPPPRRKMVTLAQVLCCNSDADASVPPFARVVVLGEVAVELENTSFGVTPLPLPLACPRILTTSSGDDGKVFSRNIHDPSLPIPIQTTSVKLLLNLVDYIFHNNDPDPKRGKRLLQRLLKVRVGVQRR